MSLHAHICMCLPYGLTYGLLQKRIKGIRGGGGGGDMMMMYGSLRAAIIHCVKTSLDKTGWSGVIQGNRIEAALTVFDSLMQNMMLGLL